MHKNKGVKFNLDDPEDLKLYEHVKEKKFATYIKRLIWQDMNNIKPSVIQATEEEETIEEDINFMNDLV